MTEQRKSPFCTCPAACGCTNPQCACGCGAAPIASTEQGCMAADCKCGPVCDCTPEASCGAS